jgi:hypothetical protein
MLLKSTLGDPETKDVVADIITRVDSARLNREAMSKQKLLHESSGPILLTVPLIVTKIVARYANLSNARHDRNHAS